MDLSSRLLYQDEIVTVRHLMGRFSVADCYLVTVLNWSAFVGLDLTRWPVVSDYYARVCRRTCVAKALTEEKAIFGEEQERTRRATV